MFNKRVDATLDDTSSRGCGRCIRGLVLDRKSGPLQMHIGQQCGHCTVGNSESIIRKSGISKPSLCKGPVQILDDLVINNRLIVPLNKQILRLFIRFKNQGNSAKGTDQIEVVEGPEKSSFSQQTLRLCFAQALRFRYILEGHIGATNRLVGARPLDPEVGEIGRASWRERLEREEI